MSSVSPELRAVIEQAVLAEHLRVGAESFKVGPIWRQFTGQIGRSTCYRVVDEYITSGRCGVHVGEAIKKGAARRAEAPAAAAMASAEVILPRAVSPTDITGQSPLQLIDLLHECMASAKTVMDHARGAEEGKVRNASLLLKAVSVQRGCLATAAAMLDTMHRVQNIERFHQAVIGVIARLQPAEAEALVLELRQTIGDWRPPV